MLRGRSRLPVLAEISGPATAEGRAWSLRRADFEQVAGVLAGVAPHSALLVTGAAEATATVAIALAGVAVSHGRRAALLECDLAAPRLGADLGLAQAPGLHEYLRWEAEPPDLLQPVALGGAASGGAKEPLVCVVAGRQAADPVTLLGLQSFRHMTDKMRDAYDLLVLSGPALGSSPEALGLLAAPADAVVAALPVAAKGRPARAARDAVRRLPAPALGAVLVDLEQ